MDIKRLKEISLQAATQNECRIYDFYKHRDRLQFFIDKSKDEISLKDCENVFHSLKFLIRAEFPEVLDQIRLEVSSPGVEKRLREFWHFEEAVNKTIKVITLSPAVSFDEKSQRDIKSQSVKGELVSVSPNEIQIKDTQRKWVVPFSIIKTAQIVFLLPKKNKSTSKHTWFNSKNRKTQTREKRGKENDFRSTI